MGTIQVWLSGVWAIVEPIAWVSTVVFSFLAWNSTRTRRKARYKGSTSKAVVALEVGRPVSEAVKAAFGRLDELVTVEAVIGKSALDGSSDYRRLASAVYKAVAKHQRSQIDLVLSGPVGLNCLIGQLVGLHHFNVVVHQFDPRGGAYTKLPQPDRAWL